MSVSSMPEHFKEIADSYDDLREFNQGLMKIMEDELNGESRILNLAAGTGRYCNELSRYHDFPLFSLDLSPDMLKAGKKATIEQGVKNFFILSDVCKLPFRSSAFSGVMIFNAIHHFHLRTCITEAKKVLEKDGRVFIYTRLKNQNERSVWGRHFPKFNEKEDRLYDLEDFEEAVDSIDGIAIDGITLIKDERRADVQELLDKAQNKHFSTFSLYKTKELKKAVKAFKDNLQLNYQNYPEIAYRQENILIVLRKTS